MSTLHNWFQATSADGRDMAPDLLRFAEMIGLERIASGRYSVLLLLGLFGGVRSGRLNPAKVIHEIECLEDTHKRSHLKPASQFDRRPALRGLWHKHYLEDGLPSMAENIRKGIAKFGLPWLKQQIAGSHTSGEERFLTEQDRARIAYDAVVGNWQQLIEHSALTGEWLIFAEHQGKKYYLCLGKHGGDEMLRSQIDAICLKEFPFLAGILTQRA